MLKMSKALGRQTSPSLSLSLSLSRRLLRYRAGNKGERGFNGCLAHFEGKVNSGEDTPFWENSPRKKKIGARLVLTLVEVLWEKYEGGWGGGRWDLRGI